MHAARGLGTATRAARRVTRSTPRTTAIASHAPQVGRRSECIVPRRRSRNSSRRAVRESRLAVRLASGIGVIGGAGGRRRVAPPPCGCYSRTSDGRFPPAAVTPSPRSHREAAPHDFGRSPSRAGTALWRGRCRHRADRLPPFSRRDLRRSVAAARRLRRRRRRHFAGGRRRFHRRALTLGCAVQG